MPFIVLCPFIGDDKNYHNGRNEKYGNGNCKHNKHDCQHIARVRNVFGVGVGTQHK